MSLTILSAKFSNADRTAIMALTEESGSVLITQSPGKAEKWAALQDWVSRGGTIAAYVAPVVPVVRDQLSELDKLRAALIGKGVVTADDLK